MEADHIERADVVVVGGGLAGMSAGLVLAQAGLAVDLFERSRTLGGRAGSVRNLRTGIAVDRGVHVLLGCCTNLLDFYQRVGALNKIKFLDSLPFIGRDGSVTTISESLLPEPFHLLPSLLRSPHLSLRDKLCMPKLLIGALSRRDADWSAMEWLIGTGQSREAVERLWEPVLVSALNEQLDRASAGCAAKVIREALVVNRAGFRMGLPTVPLFELHDNMARRALERHGVRVHLGQTVRRVRFIGDRIESVETANGFTLGVRHLVVAVNYQSPCVLSAIDTTRLKLAFAPIVNLHLWFEDGTKTPAAFCMPGRRFQWGFDRSAVGMLPDGAKSAIVLVASAARDLIDAHESDIVSLGLRELHSAFPRLPSTPLCCSLVLRTRSATFSPAPGCNLYRPNQVTARPNLFLAGDWTNTGWPSTMESAVRSGYVCARNILTAEGMESQLPVRDLPTGGLFRLLWRP